MILKTDFSDYYDSYFYSNTSDYILERYSKNFGPSKREQIKILECAGYKVPINGLVGDVLGSWFNDKGINTRIDAVVAYTNEMGHCGEGKRIYTIGQLRSNPHMGMPGGDRFYKEKQLYCTQFLGDYTKSNSFSFRRLFIGKVIFDIEYSSNNSWMSNFGDTNCKLVDIDFGPQYEKRLNYPLYAIDLIDYNGSHYAIDLNVSPGIKFTGVEDVLHGKEVVQLIEEWFKNESKRS